MGFVLQFLVAGFQVPGFIKEDFKPGADIIVKSQIMIQDIFRFELKKKGLALILEFLKADG